MGEYRLELEDDDEYCLLMDVLDFAKDQAVTDQEKIRISNMKRKVMDLEDTSKKESGDNK